MAPYPYPGQDNLLYDVIVRTEEVHVHPVLRPHQLFQLQSKSVIMNSDMSVWSTHSFYTGLYFFPAKQKNCE